MINNIWRNFGRGIVAVFIPHLLITMDDNEVKSDSQVIASDFISDRIALAKDWNNVGQDLYKACQQIEEEYPELSGILDRYKKIQ